MAAKKSPPKRKETKKKAPAASRTPQAKKKPAAKRPVRRVATRVPGTAAVEKKNRELALLAAGVCDRFRAEEVCILDMRAVCNFTDYFVLATGASATQLRGVGHEVEKAMREQGQQLLAQDGREHGRWILLDYGDVVVHLFDASARDFYQLEALWSDAPQVRLPAAKTQKRKST